MTNRGNWLAALSAELLGACRTRAELAGVWASVTRHLDVRSDGGREEYELLLAAKQRAARTLPED